MTHKKLHRLVLAALMAALTCVATNIVIPVPMVHGYVNLGDCLVLLSAFLLGPVYGAVAAGIGSALADVFLGYLSYAPGTLFIKALMAVIAGLICRTMDKRTGTLVASLVAAVAAELIMIGGYFLYEAFLLGYGTAAATSLPGNALQGIAGMMFGCVLSQVVSRIPAIRRVVRSF